MLTAMAGMERRARRRGARVSGHIGEQVPRGPVRGDPEAYRGADALCRRSSGGIGWS